MTEPKTDAAATHDVADERRVQELIDELKPPAARFRWQVGAGILVAGSIAEAVVWNIYSPDRTYQVMWSMPAVSSTLFLLFIWWTFLSGLSWRARAVGLAFVAASVGAFMAAFRFDGFDGDMWPRFSLRSSPTAEERLEQFLSNDQQNSTPKTKLPSEKDDQTQKSKLTAENQQGEVHRSAAITVNKLDWPGFRGANRDGVVRTNGRQFDWKKPLKERWRHPVGRGWSSFAVVGDFAYTQEQRDQGESVICYEMQDGMEFWRHSDPVRFEEALGGIGPRATPTFSDGHIYTVGATGILNCIDAINGDLIWQRDILDDARVENIPWAMSGSPLVVDHLVVVNPGGDKGNGVIAYDKKTGSRVWSAGNDRASYTAPSYRTLLGQKQVVIFDGVGVAGHDLKTGKELWKVDWSNDPQVNAAIPIVMSDSTFFVASGYGQGCGLVSLVKSAKGVITSNVEWSSKRFKLKFNAAVRDNKDRHLVYGLDEGILSCIDTTSGQVKWKRGRYGYGQLLIVDDMLVIQAEQGFIAVVKATGDRYEEVARHAALKGKTWNHPVICRDKLLVRNSEECICFEIPSKE